ncbi:hypothetical protein LCGC14_2963130, partial [marine sediment metagenome]
YESGLSLDEIAAKHKIARDDITYLRQLFGQKNKGAKFIERKKTEVPLTQRQKEILYGSMMGDAKKMSMSSVAFKQGKSQKDYLLWKFKEFKSVASHKSLKAEKYIDKRSEYEGETWRFYTHANTDVERCVKLFYGGGKKGINETILKELTPLSIAVWYQDDGVTDFYHRFKKEKNWNSSPAYIFCTESLSLDDCKKIQEWFLDEYKIETKLKERKLLNGVGYRIQIKYLFVDKFVDLIRPYILPMFQYKINYNSYVDSRKGKETQYVLDEIFSCPLGSDFSDLSIKEQEKLIEGFVFYYQKAGIESLVGLPDNWEDHMSSVLNINPENLLKEDFISFSNLGNKFLMSHFSNFWKASAKGGQSPKEVFENKAY